MNELDRRFLEEIMGPEGGSSCWRVVFRRGSVLTLTRLSDFGKCPGLYRPQKRLARWSYGIIRLLGGCGLTIPGLVRMISFSRSSGAILDRLETETGATIIHLLIGNPVQCQRRILGIGVMPEGGALKVLKVGFTDEARKAIERELELLAKYGGTISGVPPVTQILGAPDGKYRGFVQRLIEGEEALEALALAHLERWLDGGSRPLRDFEAWPDLVVQWKLAGICQEEWAEVAESNLKSSLVHGDFAPWNLLIDGSGDFWALDWEAGEESGIPGLDWVHYHYQIERLLRGRKFKSTIRTIERRLEASDSQGFLKLTGWAGQHRWLILAYLATNWLIEEEERVGLIEEAVGILFYT